MTITRDLLRLELAESLDAEPPPLTRRDVHLPGILGPAPLAGGRDEPARARDGGPGSPVQLPGSAATCGGRARRGRAAPHVRTLGSRSEAPALPAEGGFPEAQGASPRDRAALLAGYVDVVVLRDVIERHAVSNPRALRWVERQRMVNPRKAYPVDPGLIALFERSGPAHYGRALETAIMLELERRGFEVSYVRTEDGFEVDFLAERPGERPLLVQACLESEGDETWQRELRAFEAAAAEHRGARAFLVTLDAAEPSRPLPRGITWAPAARWLLEEM